MRSAVLLATGALPAWRADHQRTARACGGRAARRCARGHPGQDAPLGRRPAHGRAVGVQFADGRQGRPAGARTRRGGAAGGRSAGPLHGQPRVPPAAELDARAGASRSEQVRRDRHSLGLRGVRRGARPRAAVPRAGRLRHGAGDRQRDDLAADGAGVPRTGPRPRADARPAGDLQLRRRRRGDGASRRGAGGRRHARLGDLQHGRRSQAGDAGDRRRHPRPDRKPAERQAADRAQGRRRRERPLHPVRAHRRR